MQATSDRHLGAIALIALATPAVLGIETLARTLLLPAELAALREELRPTLTPIAWVLLALTAAAVPLGFMTLRALVARFLAKVEATGGGARRRSEARLEAVFVATSVPQLPAIFATFALTAGASALPVLLAAFVSAAAVIAIGLSSRPGPPVASDRDAV